MSNNLLYPNRGSPKVSAATSSYLFLVLSETELAGSGMNSLNVTILPCCFLFGFFLPIVFYLCENITALLVGWSSHPKKPVRHPLYPAVFIGWWLKTKIGKDTDEVRNRAMSELTSFFQAVSSLFFAMEQTENSNESVGYESDDVPLISLVTPNVSNKNGKRL
jgi:hypothetical protein